MPGIALEVPRPAPGLAGNGSAMLPTHETAVIPEGEANARVRLPCTAATSHMWLLSVKMWPVQTDAL